MSKKRQQKQERPTLEWRESRIARRQDELRYGDQVLAMLHWENAFSTFATGTAKAGSWTFERPRLLSRDVEVRIAGTDGGAPFGIFSPGWTDEGTLCLSDGRRYHWQCEDFWQTEWVFTSAAGEPLVRFVDTSRLLEQTTAVGIVRSELSEADRALLVLLGHYLMVLHALDSAAIAASVACTAAIT
jgi:hypothetical protein